MAPFFVLSEFRRASCVSAAIRVGMIHNSRLRHVCPVVFVMRGAELIGFCFGKREAIMLTQNWKAIILEKQGRGLKTAEKSPSDVLEKQRGY